MRTPNLITAVEASLKDFRVADAQPLIRELARRKLDRGTRLKLARLAMHAQLPETAISLLKKFVSPTSKRASPTAGGLEVVTYVEAMNRLGPSQEAVRLYNGFDFEAYPRAVPSYAFTCSRLWDWKSPISIMEKALRWPDVADHRHRAATMANLAVSYLYGEPDFDHAQQLAESAIELATREGDHLMVLNGHLILGQALTHRKRWKQAQLVLDEGLSLCPQEGSAYWKLLFRQWKEILALHLSKERASHDRALDEIEADFARLGHHANSRYCAFFRAQAVGDELALARVYFGTPYEACKAKVLETLGGASDRLPAFYERMLGPGSARKKPTCFLNAFTGEHSGTGRALKPGQALQRLLEAVACDFFDPPNFLRLHEALHPGEGFDPELSHGRVAHMVWRLRSWLAEAGLPFRLVESDGRYELVSEVPAVIRIPRRDAVVSALGSFTVPADIRFFVERAAARFAAQWFKSSEVQALTGVSDWTARDLLKRAEREGLVVRQGRGAGTLYRLARP